MASLRDVSFAIDPPQQTWSVRASVNTGIWPVLNEFPAISVRALMRRFAKIGIALRALDNGAADVWKHIGRAKIVRELRDRIRDPAIIQQSPTDFCGPLAIVMELARRHPIRYIKAAAELLDTGKLTSASGDVIEAAEDLRDRPVPDGPIDSVDWLLAATMRDDANLTDDVDDGEGIEGMTFWGAMSDWTHDVLGLNSHWETCFNGGELDGLLRAQKAINAGGVAFLLIDANLILNGTGEDEEDMHWRARGHKPHTQVTDFAPWVHSKDDALPPDHWVVYLGGLTPNNPNGETKITLRLWSWGREYELSGTADAFGEYLYAVVTGTP